MTTTPDVARPQALVYPDSDGKPMADNTEQFAWIVLLKENLESLFADCPDVFVAGDLLWYPEEGNNRLRVAPDALVAFGRPKGKRGSYKQWEEGGIAPQVVFEVLSPGNTRREMREKLAFYERYGVEEYYLYDPETNHLDGWQRSGERLVAIAEMAGWVSPRLGIRFEPGHTPLAVYRPDGQPFLSFSEQQRQAEAERAARLEQQRQAEAERAARLEQQRQAEAERAARLEQQRQAEAERAARLEQQRQAEAERAARLEQQRQAEAERAARLAAEAELARLRQRLRELGMEDNT